MITNTHPMVTRSKSAANKNILLTTTKEIVEPTTIRQALARPQWMTAMQKELDALAQNNTWDLVPHTTDMKIVCSKWILKQN